MVIDTFMFFNELDLLDIRLNTLCNHVDKFILIESNRTFSGNDKPLYYSENSNRFLRFNDKIINVIYQYNSDIGIWSNEIAQRNYAENIIRDICKSEHDIILVSDVDEIFHPSVIERYVNWYLDGVYHCAQNMFLYYLNVKNRDEFENWKDPYIMRYRNFTNSLNAIRYSKPYENVLDRGGWHFSYIGGLNNIKYKIESYSHQEYNRKSFFKKLDKKLTNLVGIKGDKYIKVEIDDYFPNFVCNNIDKLTRKGLILT
jgi:beta-1,4-mannosyl-glycoprotein beta-1,4-N-acetylglucosaminyltransferase